MSDTKPNLQGTATDSSDRRRSHRVYISMPILVRETRRTALRGRDADDLRQRAWRPPARRCEARARPGRVHRQRQNSRRASLHRHFPRPKGKRQDRSRRRVYRSLPALFLVYRIPTRGLGPIRAQAPRLDSPPPQPAATPQTLTPSTRTRRSFRSLRGLSASL